MISIFERNKDRFKESYEKIRLAYMHKEIKVPPIVISDVNAYLSGEMPSLIPEDYFENYKIMADFQIKKI